jgi:L-lactate permease
VQVLTLSSFCSSVRSFGTQCAVQFHMQDVIHCSKGDPMGAFHWVSFCILVICVVPVKAPQTESLSLRMLKFCQYKHKTHKDKQTNHKVLRLSGMMQFLIFKLVSFCCSKSEISTLVRYITKLLRQKVQVAGHWNFVSTNTRHI